MKVSQPGVLQKEPLIYGIIGVPMGDKTVEHESYMKSMSREEFEQLEPDNKLLAILDNEWGDLPPEEQETRWTKAADGADKHILLARARRARAHSKESGR